MDEAPRGYAYSLDAMLFEPASFATLVGEGAAIVAGLAEGDVLLGATSAEFRRIGIGGPWNWRAAASLRCEASSTTS